MNTSTAMSQPPSLNSLTYVAQARIPTVGGTFQMMLFRESSTGLEHIAMVMGEVAGTALVRVHSECMTGDVFGSTRCDCGPQLQFAMHQIAQEGHGVVLYLRQEGRGIGLANKLRAYALQDEGLDTVEANIRLGFAPDLRNFAIAGEMLKHLDIQAVRLMTNNPNKVASLVKAGIRVVERVSVRTPSQSENEQYLLTKALKMGHQLEWLKPGQEEASNAASSAPTDAST